MYKNSMHSATDNIQTEHGRKRT